MNRARSLCATLLGMVLGLMLTCCSSAGGECSLDADCPAGRYCQNGDCAFDCTYDEQCPEGYSCTARGRCERGCRETNGGVEICDGLDNDCDGQTDELWVDRGLPCQNGGCPAGVWVCASAGDALVCDGPMPAADDALCDGLDGDCDGQTDEDAGDQDCPLQDGVCQGAFSRCLDGAYTECGYGADFVPEVDASCDGLDNDCDGLTDEDALPVLAPEDGARATDGLDNNCNGLVDEPGGVMVPIALLPGVWIDAYEASVYAAADCSGPVLGVTSDDYPLGWPPEGTVTPTETLFACSLAGVMPSGYLSWYRAKRACEAQGKRLCTRLDWASACYGEDYRLYPYGSAFVPGVCNDAWAGLGELAPTGAHPQCVAPSGAFDMSGNQMEWMADLHEKPDAIEEAFTSGFSYVCEICDKGIDCHACADDDDPYYWVYKTSDCLLDSLDQEIFKQYDVRPYFGTRCCLDGP